MVSSDPEKWKFAKHQVHLLGREDLEGEPAAEVIAPDGRRIGVSEALWVAIEHVIESAGLDRSVHIDPLQKWVGIGHAANVTSLELEELQDWVADGRLGFEPDIFGGRVPISDVVALVRQQDAMRDAILTQMVNDPDWPDDELDDGL